ncbi:MAG: cysteine desulfurase [Armatimonadetes bacterium]|nr:cysteine desulfurase [Armatimonadota bacterium]
MRIREDFPILSQVPYGKPLVYLDNAATAQKPRAVIDATSRFYAEEYANVNRGVHYLSEQATVIYDQARETVARFINADAEEIIFTRGTTDAINLVAASWGKRIRPDDEILITEMEHHSNIVPWQLLCEERGAHLQVAPITRAGELDLDAFDAMISERTKLVSVAHISNVLGTINPIREIIRLAHAKSVPVLVDGAQSAPHMAIDVQTLDCEFYAFSGHKLFGPTGIGVLYAKRAMLEEMPPYQGGGDMIVSVSFDKSTYKSGPGRFEAGTPNIAGVVGLGEAIRYVDKIGLDQIGEHENQLLQYATKKLSLIPGLKIVGNAKRKASVISFVVEGVHPHDVGTVLDREGIAVRAGHHCAQPLMRVMGVPATLRASFAFYNTKGEIDVLVGGLDKVRELFS